MIRNFPTFFWNLKYYYRVHKSPRMDQPVSSRSVPLRNTSVLILYAILLLVVCSIVIFLYPSSLLRTSLTESAQLGACVYIIRSKIVLDCTILDCTSVFWYCSVKSLDCSNNSDIQQLYITAVYYILFWNIMTLLLHYYCGTQVDILRTRRFGAWSLCCQDKHGRRTIISFFILRRSYNHYSERCVVRMIYFIKAMG
jgi:hypothetical protein